MGPLGVPYSLFPWVLMLKTVLQTILCRFVTQTTSTCKRVLNCYGSSPMTARADQEKSIIARNRGPTRLEDGFLS